MLFHSFHRVSQPVLVLLLATGLLVLAGCQNGTADINQNDVLVWVDDVPITTPMLEQHMKLRGQSPGAAEQKTAALNELIRIQVLANRAQEQKLAAENPVVAAELALGQQRILANYFTQRFIEERPVTDEELQKAYETSVQRSGQQEVRLDSIIYSTEQAAVSALLEAEEGTTFDGLMAAARGAGLQVEMLDWINLSQVPQEYADVLAALSDGTVVPVPLRDQVGGQTVWRVFRLVGRRSFQPPTFEQVKAGLERQLQTQKIREWSDRLLQKSTVTRADGKPYQDQGLIASGR